MRRNGTPRRLARPCGSRARNANAVPDAPAIVRWPGRFSFVHRAEEIQTTQTNLTAQLSQRALTMHSFGRARRALLAVADQIAAGSAATLNEWGFGAFSTQT